MVTKTIVRQMCGETGMPLPDLNDVNNPFLVLFRQIDSMRKKNLLCDVSLLFDDGQRICAHKIVLAASSRYLKSRFTSTPGAAVRIHDVSASIGSMLVDYSYTLQIRLSKDNIEDVGAAAQKLGFLDLEDECRKRRNTKSFQEPTPEKKRKAKTKFVKAVESVAEKLLDDGTNSNANVSRLITQTDQTLPEPEADNNDVLESEGMKAITSRQDRLYPDNTASPLAIDGPHSSTSTAGLTTHPSAGPPIDSISITSLIIETAASSAPTLASTSATVFRNVSSSAIDLSENSAVSISETPSTNVVTAVDHHASEQQQQQQQSQQHASANVVTAVDHHASEQQQQQQQQQSQQHASASILAEAAMAGHSSATFLTKGDGIPIILSSEVASNLIVLNFAEMPVANEPASSNVEANPAGEMSSDDPAVVADWRKAPSKKRRIRCSRCHKSIYGSFYTFMTHVSEVHGEKTNVCPYCDKKFTRKSYLRLHVDSYHNGKNSEDMTCRLCEKQFLTKHTLRKHMRDIHENTQPYCCPHCPKAYRQESSLRDHVQLVHLSAPKFICPDCKKGFMSMKDRDNHRQFVHLGKKAPKLACPECDKVFTEAHLRKHVAAVHEGLKMKCEECELEFSSRAVLTRHKEVVHAKRRFRCTLCLAEYRDLNAWRKHHQSQHIGTRFPCAHCNRSFKSRNAMTRHVESAHRGLRFTCQICSKTFSQKSMLITHTKVVHMGHVQHPCTLCDSGFSRPALLKDHMLKAHQIVIDDSPLRSNRAGGNTVNVFVAEDPGVGNLGADYENLGYEDDLNPAEAAILTTDSDLISTSASLDGGLGAPTYVITTTAPDGSTLPDGAQIIEPSNILYAADIPAGNSIGEGEMTLIYNGEVVTASNVGGFGGPIYEFV